ncbi:MAG: RND transporter [Nitrospira bacterium SG8_35_4]|nr:MAG: RND transporter [Nitrospira bacterium SG8_35_4]
MDWLEKQFGEKVVAYRWWIITATVIVVLTAAHGTRFLELNNDTRVFFSKENPQLQALEALENTYNRIDNVLFVLAPKDGKVFTRKTLAAVESLTEASWQIPYSSRVDSITNFQHTRAADDALIVEDLVRNAGGLSDDEISRIRLIATSEPSLANRLISPSADVTGVNINVLIPRKSIDEVPEVAAFAREMADGFREKYPDIELYLTGAVMFDNAFGEASLNDIRTLVPLMLCAVVIIIGLTLRSFAGTFVTLAIIVMSTATALGVTGWLGVMLNPASASAPTIILVLAVADSVHILAILFQQMRLGRSKHEAVEESVRLNLLPVFLTSATTAIGFLTMNFSDAPPFRDLGNIVALGVTAAFVYSVTFLPALLSVLPIQVKPQAERSGTACKSCDRLAGFVIHRRKRVFLISLTLMAAVSLGTINIELNDDWIKYFDESFPVRRAAEFTEKHLRGFDIIEYSLDAGETGGINRPDYLAKVEKFADWYETQPHVVHVSVITDVYKRLNKSMHGDDPAYYRIPGQRDLAAQYLLLYEMSLPFGLDLNSYINVDKSATRLIVSFRDMTSRDLREMDDRARAWLNENAPEMFTYGSGLSIIWAHISQRNINNMLGASMMALVLISFLLIVAFRSLKLGLVSLIPNLAPVFMGFGLWGIVYSRVGLGLSVVAAMTLGIVVDDTIHFISKYIRARREQGSDPAGAVRYAFHTVGTAMWITTAALVSGFLVLTWSGYRMNSDMGLLSAITITLALALDFFFLPTLLMKVDRGETGMRDHPTGIRD